MRARSSVRTAASAWRVRRYAEVVPGGIPARTCTTALGVHRATLHRTLREALPASPLHTDAEVEHVESGPNRAEVRYRRPDGPHTIGDAAHATTPNLGQGAAQATEDAVVLGAVCAGGAEGLPAALAAYDEQRRPRSQAVARASVTAGRFGQQLHNPVAVAVRDTALRLTPGRVALRSVARYADWRPPVG
ncbi:FAD-dependent monooxygenase [Micromonospora sp. NPDC050276]|uniref:FAD-dependent monooxygenase n=1 Tax=Micromonospora sp. NPDC050276 TaxID=3364278 RepID=UPI0037889471